MSKDRPLQTKVWAVVPKVYGRQVFLSEYQAQEHCYKGQRVIEGTIVWELEGREDA